jgi:hypothetical protein
MALAELALKPLILTAEEIRREPRYANSRLVWFYNGIAVPLGLRMRVLQVLIDDGPMPLGQLLKSIPATAIPRPR